MATMALKACIRGRSGLRPRSLVHLYPSRARTSDRFSSTTETVAAGPLHDFCQPNVGLRFFPSLHFHSASSNLLHPNSTSRSPSTQCFFSTQGRSDGDEVLSEENDGTEEGNEEEEGDELDMISQAQIPLPDFKDPVEEAAYIGYKVVGRVKPGDFGSYRPPKAFAIIQVGSHQFKISPGDCIYTEKLKFADVNDKLCLERVLLLGSKSQTIIGRPLVPKAYVHAAVEEQVLDAKVIVFKKKRRKNYRRCNGHRQELTRLRILDIWGLGEARSAFVGSSIKEIEALSLA